jgi:hypothetical protein
MEEPLSTSPMVKLVTKLKSMKSLVIKWEKNKKLKSKEELVQIEVDLDILYSANPGGIMRDDDRERVTEKEKRKLELLKQEEETWRQKRRITWLNSGDKNTKFFHAFANFRKKTNTIWEIRKEDGSVETKHKDLEKEVVTYFEKMFKVQEDLSIIKQLEVIQTYPRLFSVEEGKIIVAPVLLPEVLSTLKGFSISKILDLMDGQLNFSWNFLIFWDIIFWKQWRNPESRGR